ncbi:MAG: hypothetical protein IPN13_01030 [Bacteroidetes bacterium]|nr:hypothetical protein [Bacteroidota bacterium]MBK8872552.1 hypothetical protein [Bacteroidota bacterium]
MDLKLLILLCLFVCCSTSLFSQQTHWVDDILPDSLLDDPTFRICNTEDQVIQYFNSGKGMEYEGDKPALTDIFHKQYKPVTSIGQTGFIRIRFIVNCKGESGRFRMLCSDLNYLPVQFDTKITDQLLAITKSLKGWKPKRWKETEIDYYQYLFFKIEEGNLATILP